MTRKVRMTVASVALAGAIILSSPSGAQKRNATVASRSTAYDMVHETVIQGVVVSYSEDFSRPPLGAHVTVQADAGTVDVHLGPAAYLRANHLSLSAGDSVKFVGVSISTKRGDVFLARIVQNGKQTVALRSTHGFLLAATAARALPQAERTQRAQQGVPR
jgi:hypothetical protein